MKADCGVVWDVVATVTAVWLGPEKDVASTSREGLLATLLMGGLGHCYWRVS